MTKVDYLLLELSKASQFGLITINKTIQLYPTIIKNLNVTKLIKIFKDINVRSLEAVQDLNTEYDIDEFNNDVMIMFKNGAQIDETYKMFLKTINLSKQEQNIKELRMQIDKIRKCLFELAPYIIEILGEDEGTLVVTPEFKTISKFE